MLRKDVKTGVVYGYYDGRITTRYGTYYSYVRPLVVLDTTVSQFDTHGLRPAEGLPMRRGSWNKAAVGFPAVILEDPAFAGLAARVWDRSTFSVSRSLVHDGEVIGHYTLVTISGHLHGLYYDLMAEMEKANAAAKADRLRRANEKADKLAAHADLRARLSKIGIEIRESKEYAPSTRLELTFEQGDKLISFAESYKHFWGNTV